MADDRDDAPRDENKLIAERRRKLDGLREAGDAYPNDFDRDALAGDLHARYGEVDGDALPSRSASQGA